MQKASVILILSVLLLIFALPTMAGVDWKAFDVGNFQSAIFNTGIVGFPQDPTRNPSGWWPAGSNDSYIFSGDLWLGAKKGGRVGVSISDARNSEIWPSDDVPEVVSQKPGTTTKGTPTSQSIFYKATDTNAAVNNNPLGLEIEVNGFQWGFAPLFNFFILEHKLKNIGTDTLTDVYIAFRYDVDVSSLEAGTANYSADDFVALDQTPDDRNPDAHPNRHLSYGFSNGTAKGYVGLRVLDAYRGADPKAQAQKIPFTAHKRITIATDPSTDEEMYALISTQGVDPLPANFDDQRFIQSWGPIETLAPGEEFNVVIAVGIGEGLNGLRASVDWAQKLYDDDYVAPGPPPPPKLTAYPADRKVALVWDGTESETYADPTDPEKIFEGYRVYRRTRSFDSTSGKPIEDWQMLAEFDKTSATGNFLTVAHVGGPKSDATITNEGDEPFFGDFFKNAEYIIKFVSDTTFEIINTGTWELLEYNPTLEDGGGYAVIKDPNTGEPFPDGTYRPGELIYFGGLYVKIDGRPVAGDIFQIVSTTSQPIGEDKGVKTFYTDENLINGTRYIYAVTAFDTGNPKTGLPGMESSRIETTTHAFPRSQPAGYREPSIEMELKGAGAVTVEPVIVEPPKVTGHRYKLAFTGVKTDPEKGPAFITGGGYIPPKYEIIDLDTGQKVVEAQEFGWYDPNEGHAVEVLSPLFDGIALQLTGVDVTYGAPTANKITRLDLVTGDVPGWSTDIQEAASGGGDTTGPNIFWATYYRTHTYRIQFVTDTTIEVFDVTVNEPVPFNPERADGYAISNQGWKEVYDPAVTHNPDENIDLFRIYLKGAYIVIKDPNRQLSAGDAFEIEMAGVQAPSDGDEIVIATQAPAIALTKETVEAQLRRIRVVPNPYILTNRAVISPGTDRCFFTHLPAKCRIRIYTMVGEFVRELMHDSGQPFDPENRAAQGDAGGTEPFDLLSYNNQALASGVYIYAVEALDNDGTTIGKKIGRFAIIR